MARFQLTAPVILNTVNGPAQYNAGDVVDSSSFLRFTPVVSMTPLDTAAKVMMVAEFDRVCAGIRGPGGEIPGEIPGVGPVSIMQARALSWGLVVTIT